MRKVINQTTGKWGEETAAIYLQQHGWIILGRNIRTKFGEIDLVAQFGELIVFFEVKTRTNKAYGTPEQAITAKKAEHMLNSAVSYIDEHPELGTDWRIDVLSIEGKPEEGDFCLEWFENAVTAG